MTDDGRRGDFPFNYVEVINEAEIPRIRTASIFVTDKAPKTELSSSVDKIISVKVTASRGKAEYLVEVQHSKKSVIGEKSMEDFRHLDDMLRFLYPNYEKALTPLWADKIFENDFAASKKAKALENYLQKVVITEGVGTEETEYALIFWLNREEEFAVSDETKDKVDKADKIAAKGDGQRFDLDKVAEGLVIAAVIYNWEAADPVELALQAGTYVLVRNQQTPNEGWWEGEDASGARGIFPSTYVKLVSENDVHKALNGQMPLRPLPQPENFGAMNTPAPTRKQNAKASNRQPKTETNFKITSLDAFDEMLTDGFTMLTEENELHTKRADATVPKTGDKVMLNYVAYVWDCQKQRIIEYAASDLPDADGQLGPLSFTVGRGETIKGLERAVQSLEKGQKSRVVIRPELGYGEVGKPPSVPPNCHLIFDLTLDEFSEGTLEGPTAMGSATGYVGNRARRPQQSPTYHDM